MTSNPLPLEIMKNALKLRNCTRVIYITLYLSGKPCTSEEIAQKVGHQRAYVNMRLQQIVERGFAKVEQKGRRKYFEALA